MDNWRLGVLLGAMIVFGLWGVRSAIEGVRMTREYVTERREAPERERKLDEAMAAIEAAAQERRHRSDDDGTES